MRHQTESFLQDAFVANPSYSFDDPTIMIEHSKTVRDVALQIEEVTHCRRNLLEVMALLHDIGKAYPADEQTLREKHAELGYEVARDFIAKLDLGDDERMRIVTFLKGDMESLEAQIIKDADIIAFFVDEQLQKALKEWGDKNDLPNELQRKANKFEKLKFGISREIAKEPYQKMLARWNLSVTS